MENENEVIITPEEDELELDLDLEDKPEEKKEEKPQETPEARLARLKRMVAQQEKKLGKTEDKPVVETKKTDELDYGQKAYLRAEGIKSGKEEALILEVMRQTGKKIEDVLESKYFQAELSELREKVATENAIPRGSKRTGQTASDDVAYWLAKGEMPPRDQVELRRKVVNAKLKQQTEVNVFSKNPIVGKY